MEEKCLNVRLIKNLIERKNDFKIGEKEEFFYRNDYGNVWKLVLRREEESSKRRLRPAPKAPAAGPGGSAHPFGVLP